VKKTGSVRLAEGEKPVVYQSAPPPAPPPKKSGPPATK